MDAISDDDLAALVAAANATVSPKDTVRGGPLMEVEFEALAYMLRVGSSALSRAAAIDKLARCNREQATEIVARLTRRSASNETPWTPKQIRKLRDTAKEAMQ